MGGGGFTGSFPAASAPFSPKTSQAFQAKSPSGYTSPTPYSYLLPPAVVEADGGQSSISRVYTFTPTARGTNTQAITFKPTTGYSLPSSTVTLTGTAAMEAYWKGGHGGAWNSKSPGYNWTVANGSSTEINWLPNANTDIFFTLGNPGTTSTTLGQDVSVKSVTFAATSAPMTIGGSNSLTIVNGLTLASGGTASQTISCPVQLGATQTWEIDGSGPLIVSGSISGSGSAALVKSGSGTLILSGSDSYMGGTTVADGTLILASPSAIAGGTSLTVAADGTLQFDPSASGSPVAASRAAAAVPEPSTIALLGVVPIGLIVYRWRRIIVNQVTSWRAVLGPVDKRTAV